MLPVVAVVTYDCMHNHQHQSPRDINTDQSLVTEAQSWELTNAVQAELSLGAGRFRPQRCACPLIL